MTRCTPRTRDAERGTVLIVVILITFMLGSLSFAFLQESLAEKSSIDLREANLAALQIAERGVVEASMEVLSQHDGADDGIGFVTGDYAGGHFEVTATRDPDNPDRWTVNAHGHFRDVTRRLEVGLRRRAGGHFVEGLFSKDGLTFNGLTGTDAYDSRLGSYASQAVNHDSGGTYADGGGHIGSNRGITLHGSSVLVRGNAIPGPLHVTSMSGNPTVWGDILPRRQEIQLPPVGIAEFQAALNSNNNAELLAGGGSGGGSGSGSGSESGGGGNGNGNGHGNGNGNGNGNGGGGSQGGGGGSQGGGNVTYDPNTYSLSSTGQGVVNLSGGTYFFTDVRLTGQSVLQINGPTTLYVTGDLDLSGGGVVNTSGRPSDLLVYVHPYHLVPGHAPSGSTVKVRGGSEAAMALYAPGATLTVAGGDDIWGSFVADTITLSGNTHFHYDKALGEVDTSEDAFVERLYWRDLDEKLR